MLRIANINMFSEKESEKTCMKSVNKTKIALAFLFSIFKFFVGHILQGILSESTNFHLHVFLASDMRDCNYVSKVFLNCRNADIFGLNS